MYIYEKKILMVMFFLIDAVGYLFALPLRIFRKEAVLVPKKILIIRLDHIGDVVEATVVLKPLRKKLPDAEIVFMAHSRSKDILEKNPHIDKVISFDAPWFDRKSHKAVRYLKALAQMINTIRTGSFNAAVDLRGDVRHITAMFFAGVKSRISYGITGGGFLLTHIIPYRKKSHETEKNIMLLGPFGITAGFFGTELYYSEKDAEKAESLKKDAGISDKYAVMHAFPGHSSKKWNADKFRAVTRYLRSEKGLQVVIVGTASEEAYIKGLKGPEEDDGVIDISGKTGLGMLGHILKKASIFVGLDSGPSHIAAAEGVPGVVLFSGVNDPGQWAPRSEKIKIIYPGEGKDLSGVSTEEVCGAIDEVLDKSQK